MILKSMSDDGVWEYQDDIKKARVDKRQSPGITVHVLLGNGEKQGIDVPGEAYLLNDNGKTIERLN